LSKRVIELDLNTQIGVNSVVQWNSRLQMYAWSEISCRIWVSQI